MNFLRNGLCLTAFFGFALVACQKPTPTRLDVQPEALNFASSGDALVLRVSVFDEQDKPLEAGPCTFISTDPGVASVKLDGTVVASLSGEAQIRVGCGGLVKSIPVVVSLPSVVQLSAACDGRCERVAEEPLSLRLEGFGARTTLAARVLDNAGQPVPAQVRYEVTDPEFRAGTRKPGVQVSGEGVVEAVGVGRFLIIATAGSAVGKASVEVVLPRVDVVRAPRSMRLKPGASSQIEVTTLRRIDRSRLEPVSGARLAYQVDNPKILRLGDEGRVMALAEGRAEVIIAADSGAFAQVEVVVSSKDPPVTTTKTTKTTKGTRRTMRR